MKNQKAFTLVELIIVIAIIAILAAAIFVAIDPARRLHETRNARRANDIATILDAIKVNQADSGGEYFATVAATTNDLYYQIGTDASGCTRACAGATTQDPCVDLSGIGSNYLATVPYDPTDSDAQTTGYAMTKDSNGALTVMACNAEGEGPGGNGAVPTISVSR